MEANTTYFDTLGEECTGATFTLAKKRAAELGIKTVLVASTHGKTAVAAVKFFKGFKVIAVSHVTGSMTPDIQPFTVQNRKLVESKGGIVLTTAHAFAGVSRAMRSKHNMYMLGEIIADTLRVFGQGTKVSIEIALMAADAGLVRTDEEVISIGGTGRGADTALVLNPTNSHTFFDLKVKEIICKPRVG